VDYLTLASEVFDVNTNIFGYYFFTPLRVLVLRNLFSLSGNLIFVIMESILVVRESDLRLFEKGRPDQCPLV